MLKRFLELSLLSIFLLALNNEGQAQVNNEPLINRFKSFLGELSTNISILADNSYTGTDDSEQRTWIKQHFFDNASIFDECTNQSQNIKDFISIKLPYLQKEFEFIEYNFELIRIEINNSAIVKKTIRVNNSILYSGKCYIEYSIFNDDFKIKQISNSNIEKNELPENFCKKIIKKKNKNIISYSFIGMSLAFIGSSMYFKAKEDTYYANYKIDLDNNTYTKANNAHHTKLVLRYSGIIFSAIGTTLFIKNVINEKKSKSFSNVIFIPQLNGITFIANF